jgi:hypothetical protein
MVQQQKLMSGDNNTVVIEKVLKALEEFPQDFFCSWSQYSDPTPAPVYEPQEHLGVTTFGVCVWALLILSFIIGLFKYIW